MNVVHWFIIFHHDLSEDIEACYLFKHIYFVHSLISLLQINFLLHRFELTLFLDSNRLNWYLLLLLNCLQLLLQYIVFYV